MKILTIICLLVAILAWHNCPAQSNPLTKKKRKISSPITLFSKSKTLFDKGPWLLCADVAYNKNSLPYSRLDNNLLREYHGSLPLYGCYVINQHFALEGGAYVGVSANRPEQLGISPLPLETDMGFDLAFDSGLVSGISFNLKQLGKLKMRYNYGLSSLLTVENRSIKTRRLDVGLSFDF